MSRRKKRNKLHIRLDQEKVFVSILGNRVERKYGKPIKIRIGKVLLNVTEIRNTKDSIEVTCQRVQSHKRPKPNRPTPPPLISTTARYEK